MSRRGRCISAGGQPVGVPQRAPARVAASANRRIADLASHQHGMVSRAQLRGLGIPAASIDDRVRSCRLHRVHRGVYAVGALPTPLPWPARAAAAVLAGGAGALLSHRSAAALWDLVPWSAPLEVTVASQRNPTGLRPHRSRTLTLEDRARRHGIAVTGLPRTLVDLATLLDERALERAYSEAKRRYRLSDASLRRALERSGNPRARGSTERVLALGAGPARSVLETQFAEFLRRHRLPPPRMNVMVAGHEVDFHWPEARVVVELDGFAFHGDRVAFERDRLRDADLVAAGECVLRLTWRRLTARGDEEAERLRRLIATRTAPVAAVK